MLCFVLFSVFVRVIKFQNLYLHSDIAREERSVLRNALIIGLNRPENKEQLRAQWIVFISFIITAQKISIFYANRAFERPDVKEIC